MRIGARKGVAYYFLTESLLNLLNKMCGKLDGQQKGKDVYIKLIKLCNC